MADEVTNPILKVISENESLRQQLQAERQLRSDALTAQNQLKSERDASIEDAIRLQARAEKAEAALQKYHSDLADENLKRLRAEEDARKWKSHWEMYAAAWLRELGGELLPKHHHIDALVKTTKYHKERSDRCERAEAELRSLKAAGEGWIPCAERMPEKSAMPIYKSLANYSDFVLVVTEGNDQAWLGSWDTHKQKWNFVGPADHRKVTHWRPLPPAPAKPAEGPAE